MGPTLPISREIRVQTVDGLKALFESNGLVSVDSWSTAIRLFTNHVSNSKRRGIPFRFTFMEWLLVWLLSGHWPERGRLKHNYCMSRRKDMGAYEQGNVDITLRTINDKEREALKDRAQSLRNRGSNNWSARLTENQVLEIKSLISMRTMKQGQIAKLYKIDPREVSKIKHGFSWNWLNG